MVRTRGLSFLSWSTKAFSLVRRCVEPIRPPCDLSVVPLWHSVFFRNEHRHTHYNSTLISQGVLPWGQLMEEEHSVRVCAIPASWRAVYLAGRSHMNSVKAGVYD